MAVIVVIIPFLHHALLTKGKTFGFRETVGFRLGGAGLRDLSVLGPMASRYISGGLNGYQYYCGVPYYYNSIIYPQTPF